MDFLSLQATLHSNKLAVSDLSSGWCLNYKQLHSLVAQTVTWLDENGIKRGDRVVCLSKNCAETIVLSLACGRAGTMLVPLNWRLSSEEIRILIDDCQPKVIFVDEMGEKLGLEHIDIHELPKMVVNKALSLNTTEHHDLPSLILYTSGTTGVPKGVMHSESSIMETTLNMSLLAYVDDKSVFLCEAPMFHVIGLISSIRPVLYHGGTVLISDGFVPERTLARMSDKKLGVTHYFCVPQMANLLRQQPNFDPSQLKGLKALLTGGAPHPEVQIKEWLSDGIPIVDGYGMSEAGTIFHMPFDIDMIDKKAGYVGVPGHRILTRIADSNGKVVSHGTAGEIQIKGNNLFLGIWNKSELYQQCFTDDGWFKTGDVAVKDEDGFHRIVDRIKDMFISGGENVYPVEVEGLVLKDEQVFECALVGVPDEKWGEVGCLYVVLNEGFDELDENALLTSLNNSLARYKLPKYFKVIEQLPRNGAGKVQKNLLKDLPIE